MRLSKTRCFNDRGAPRKHCGFYLSSGPRHLEVPARPASVSGFFGLTSGDGNYRAPASACNACPSKAACTDSNHGREIERNLADVEHGMKRFHRAFSFTLLVLASVILVVELFRSDGIYARTVLIIVLILFCGFIWRLGEALIATRMKEAK